MYFSTRWFIGIMVLLGVGLGLVSHGLVNAVNEPEQVIPEVIIEYVPVETTVIKEVEVVREIEVIKEVPLELRDFASIEELEQWLAQDDTDSHIFLKANKDGVIKLTGACEDYAIQLQDRALKDGYKMSIQIQGGGRRLHAINLVVIGNEYYYIEPQTDRFWLAGYLD